MKEDKMQELRVLNALELEWSDHIMISSEYFRELSNEYSYGNISKAADWNEMKEAFLEMHMFKDLYQHYKNLLRADEINKAILFADNVLNKAHLNPKELVNIHSSLKTPT